MNCEAVNGLLDRLMDGELSDEEMQALLAHGRECPACDAAIRATMQMKALFSQMEREVDVPLAAQAGWRNAVRAEARRRRVGRLTRWIGSAAAAVVVLVGVGLALNLRGAPGRDSAAQITAAQETEAAEDAYTDGAAETASYDEAEPEEAWEATEDEAMSERSALAPLANGMDAPLTASGAEAPETVANGPDVLLKASEAEASEPVAIDDDAAGFAAESAVVEADGAQEAATAGEQPQGAPACELAVQVEDVLTACDRIRDLAEEYEGAAEVQTLADGGANVYVTLDAENAPDFFGAVLPMDRSGRDVSAPELAPQGRVIILLTLTGA